MNILSIGNSFSQDAQRYLHRIAKADGVQLNTVNLYIGGCSLSRHYRNMLSGERAYDLQVNGESTGFPVSLDEALLNRDWDVVTVQQASHASNNYDTYQPYLEELAEHIRLCAPKAKLAVHQTWAYEQGSQKLTELLGYEDYKQMLSDVADAYQQAATDIQADLLIPAGRVLGALLEHGVEKVHRDTFHASYGLGRYALGLIWYKAITGKDVVGNAFSDFDEEIPPEQIALAQKCVEKIAKEFGF